jgi:hypothetical protein
MIAPTGARSSEAFQDMFSPFSDTNSRRYCALQMPYLRNTLHRSVSVHWRFGACADNEPDSLPESLPQYTLMLQPMYSLSSITPRIHSDSHDRQLEAVVSKTVRLLETDRQGTNVSTHALDTTRHCIPNARVTVVLPCFPRLGAAEQRPRTRRDITQFIPAPAVGRRIVRVHSSGESVGATRACRQALLVDVVCVGNYPRWQGEASGFVVVSSMPQEDHFVYAWTLT